jgi:nucleotide-binding universal stress UspA family protein
VVALELSGGPAAPRPPRGATIDDEGHKSETGLMIKRILVALSGTPYTRAAIQHALELARDHGADVTGVTDINLAKVASVGPVPMGAGAAAHDLMEHRLQLTRQQVEEAIADFEATCAEAGRTSTVVREAADPYDTIISVWRYHDLVVAGLRGLFEYGVLHQPDDVLIRLIDKGVRPILAVARQHRPIRRVLVAYNGSMESAKALKRFIQMKLWPEVEVKIACFDGPPDEAEVLLADAVDYCRAHGVEAEHQHVQGPPRERLLEHAAEWQADLIVMGTTSRARILQHLLGDTTLHALRHAEIPLFLTQ